MTALEARAIEKARKEMQRAKKELQFHRLQETRYRGIPSINCSIQTDNHGEFTYRGVTYEK